MVPMLVVRAPKPATKAAGNNSVIAENKGLLLNAPEHGIGR